MADDQIPPEVEKEIEKTTGPSAAGPVGVYQPIYKMIGDSKIPVSKARGKLWKSRKDQGLRAMKDFREAWYEAIRYYNNDQMEHRGGEDGTSGTPRSRGLSAGQAETENIVYANATTLVPLLYSKNPTVEFTASSEEDNARDFATVVERVVNRIIAKKVNPGINLKPKIKKAVLSCLLTNCAWIKIGYTFREASIESAIKEIEQLSTQLTDAKTTQEIEKIEGRLMALEQAIDVLQPSGPYAKFVGVDRIVVDPESRESDHNDANWLMEYDYLPTEYLIARFGNEEEDDGRRTKINSVYQPTHVLKVGATDDAHDDVNNFSLFDRDAEAKSYGYVDNDSYEKAKRTKVWYVWDKVTRRVEMYNDKDWCYPIWVWDDPLHLDRFLPYYKLSFYENPEETPFSKGEVSYYLDQQDAINEINDEERRARGWARRNIFFDKNAISREDVESVLKGEDGTARGVDLPEGKTMKDVVWSMVPPSMAWGDLFNKASKYQSIERISSVSAALQNSQFKTNTTNQAIEHYQGLANIRNDEKTDAIEDFVGDIGWGIAQLCLQFMSAEEVAAITSKEDASLWQNLTYEQIATQFSASVVGGSSQKPTSAAKKKEAIEVGQVLGQYVQISPVALEITLRLMEKSFDDIVIKEEDWEMLREAIMQRTAQPTTDQEGAGPQSTVQGEDPRAAIAKIVQSLPPEAKAMIEQMIQSGMSPSQALQQVQEQMQTQQ